jgi:hypothetical protein
MAILVRENARDVPEVRAAIDWARTELARLGGQPFLSWLGGAAGSDEVDEAEPVPSASPIGPATGNADRIQGVDRLRSCRLVTKSREPLSGFARRQSMTRTAILSATLAGLLLLGACAPAGPGASVGPRSADEAVALVLAHEERFAGIRPYDPGLIGQAAWYEVAEAADGWRVVIRIGWGDCPAGCISEHRWTYAVGGDGGVSLLGETGDPLPDATGISGIVLAGPTCPVERDPPDPACADQPVGGAVLLVRDGSGAEVARVTSGADGTFAAELAPGLYRVVPQPVEGLLGTASEMDVEVEADQPRPALIILYDTGIR